jgi:phospho-N-acetylmuramoyl-pentapeptide-transferase
LVASFDAIVRLAAAPLTALLLVLLLGGPLIRLLRRAGAGQRVRDDGPQRHLQKEGTPTMGGLLILGATVVAALTGERWLAGHIARQTAMLLAAAVLFGLIGLADDWLKVKRGRSLGLKARHKLGLQFVTAGLVLYALAQPWAISDSSFSYLPWWPVWALVVVATSNAMNLADGLDGLAAGLCAVAALGFGILAMAHGQPAVFIVAASLAGSCLGFLWYNRHPARVFMGDVGSLALGGTIAMMGAALMSPTRSLTAPILALVGLCVVPYIEEASVIVQVISFKTTGKRIIKMSPLHHHFELSGWSERKVVWTFWAVGAAAAAVTVGISIR